MITTTSGTGADKDERPDEEQSVTVTLLATPEQAEILARFSHSSIIHFVLVCRGDKDIADQFIKAQDDYLTNSNNISEDGNG